MLDIVCVIYIFEHFLIVISLQAVSPSLLQAGFDLFLCFDLILFDLYFVLLGKQLEVLKVQRERGNGDQAVVLAMEQVKLLLLQRGAKERDEEKCQELAGHDHGQVSVYCPLSEVKAIDQAESRHGIGSDLSEVTELFNLFYHLLIFQFFKFAEED